MVANTMQIATAPHRSLHSTKGLWWSSNRILRSIHFDRCMHGWWSQLSDVEVQQSIVLQWMRIEHIGRLEIQKDEEYLVSRIDACLMLKPFAQRGKEIQRRENAGLVRRLASLWKPAFRPEHVQLEKKIDFDRNYCRKERLQDASWTWSCRATDTRWRCQAAIR